MGHGERNANRANGIRDNRERIIVLERILRDQASERIKAAAEVSGFMKGVERRLNEISVRLDDLEAENEKPLIRRRWFRYGITGIGDDD